MNAVIASQISAKTNVLQRLMEAMSEEDRSKIKLIKELSPPTQRRNFHMNCRHIKVSTIILPMRPLTPLLRSGSEEIDSAINQYNQVINNYNETLDTEIKII